MDVPGYRIGREVTTAGAFQLLRATREEDGASVILKVPDAARLPSATTRLRHEWELTNALSLDGVLRPLAWAEARDGAPVLILEGFGDATLAQRLSQGRVEPRAACRIALSLARALGAIHEQGILHRDLNPSSILVGTDGESVKLTGFTLATRRPRAEVAPLAPRAVGGHARIPLARRHGTHPPQRGLARRLLFHGRGALRAAHRTPPLRGHGCAGPHPRPRRPHPGSARHRRARAPPAPLRHRPQAPRQVPRGPLPERLWARGGPPAMPECPGGPGARRPVRPGRQGRPRALRRPRETVRPRTPAGGPARGLRARSLQSLRLRPRLRGRGHGQVRPHRDTQAPRHGAAGPLCARQVRPAPPRYALQRHLRGLP